MDLNIFWKPKKEKKKSHLNDNFLLPKDKKEIEKLAEAKSRHLQNVAEINHKITLIHNSTGTLVPQFVRLHNNLRQKYRWYYGWHTKPYAKSIHWLVLLLYIIALPLAYFYLIPNILKTKATTYDFPRWEWVAPSGSGNDLNKTVYCSNQDITWAIGTYGTALRSLDHGQTWEQTYTGTENALNDILCFDNENIIAVGDNDTLLRYSPDIGSWTLLHTYTTPETNYGNYQKIIKQNSTTILGVYKNSKYISVLNVNSQNSWSRQYINTAISGTIFTSDIAKIDDTSALFQIDNNAGYNNFKELIFSNNTWEISSNTISGFSNYGDTVMILNNNPTFLIVNRINLNQLKAIDKDPSNNWRATSSSGYGGVDIDFTSPIRYSDNSVYIIHNPASGNAFLRKFDYLTTPSFNEDAGSAISLSASSYVYANLISENEILAIANNTISLANLSTHTATDISGAIGDFVSFTEISDSEIVTVGKAGAITKLTKTNGDWSAATIQDGSESKYKSMTKLDDTTIVAVGDQGSVGIIEYENNNWQETQISGGGSNNFTQVIANDANNALAISSTGVYHISGPNWQISQIPTAIGGYLVQQDGDNFMSGNGLFSKIVFDGVNYAVTTTSENLCGPYGNKNKLIYYNSMYYFFGLNGGSNQNYCRMYIDPEGEIQTTSVLLPNFIPEGAISSVLSDVVLVGSKMLALGITTYLSPGPTGFAYDISMLEDIRIVNNNFAFKKAISDDSSHFWALARDSDSNHDILVHCDTSLSCQLVYDTSVESSSNDPLNTGLTNFSLIDANNALLFGVAGSQVKVSNINSSAQGTVYSAITSANLLESISLSVNNILTLGNGVLINYHSPANATATKLLIQLPGQFFADGKNVSGTPNEVQAGDSVTATIYAVNAINANTNELDKGNASWAGFTTTDPNDSNPGTIQLTEGIIGQPDTCIQNPTEETTLFCGRGTATFVFHTPGTWTVTASDINGVLSAGTSSSITVTAGDPEKLYYSECLSSLNLGSASGAITLGVKDAYGNNTIVTSSKTVRLTTNSADGRFSTSPNGPWTKGQLDVTISAGSGSTTFYYLDFRTGSSTITATETSEGWTAATCNITINTGTLSQSTLSLSSNSLSSCGGSITATVTLKNSEGLALTDRTVQLLSSRNTTDTISPTSAITDSSGTATFTVSSNDSGDATLTAYNQTDNLYLPESQDIHVSSSGLAKINLSSNVSVVAVDTPFDLTTTMNNACGGTITDYSGDAEFTSTDNSAKFQEKKHTFSSSEGGKFTQSVTFRKEGNQSISVSAGGIISTISITVTTATTLPDDATPTATASTVIISPTPTESPQSLIETFKESPIAKTISKVLTPITATVATLGIFPLLVQAFPQGFHILASLFPTVFTAAAVRRRRKPWGNVYDSFSNKPVDLAVVRVFNAVNDRLVATKVTDENGRFNFLLAKGKYYVTVTKSGFSFPPKISKLKASQLSTRFGPQGDIYFGQSFVIGEDDTNLNLNIALDPKLSTLSTGTKLMMWIKNGFDWLLIAISYFVIPLMLFGAVFAAIATYIIPSRFNFYMSGTYVVLLVAYLISSRIKAIRLGIVFNAKSRRPVANATVLIFDKEYSAIREIKTTDEHGHFAILAQKGQYYLTVHAKGYKFPSKDFKFQKGDKKLGTLYLGQTINNKKADFINVSIPIDKD